MNVKEKLLFLNPTRFPSERAHSAQIAHMCAGFSAVGYDVCLVCPDTKNHSVMTLEALYGVSADDVAVVRLGKRMFAVSSTFGFVVNFLSYTYRATQFVRRTTSSVVYSRDEFVLLFVSLMSPRKRLVWESHEAKYNFAARMLFRRDVVCIAISDGIKKHYLANGVNADQIIVAYDAVDNSFFGTVETAESARQRLGISASKPVVMYIGGLDSWKGVQTFFAAAALDESASYVVVGGKLAEIDQYAKLHPRVNFVGSRPYSELKDTQQAADVLVIPNTATSKLASLYTSPLKLFAHMTSRKPLVVSDVPSLRSVLGDQGATYFEADNPVSLVNSVQFVIANKGLSLQSAVHTYEKSKQYTWEKRAAQITSAVEKRYYG